MRRVIGGKESATEVAVSFRGIIRLCKQTSSLLTLSTNAQPSTKEEIAKHVANFLL